MLPPLPLDRFSHRAQRLLLAAERAEVERDPDAIARRLAACGRPVSQAVVDFERTYGGLSWGEETLGILYEEPLRDEHDPLDLDRTMVAIGSEGVLGRFMSAAGEVITQPNVRSASIEALLEQRALLWSPDLRGPYRVKVRPSSGGALAAALGLDPVVEATDAYQAFFAGDGVLLHHHRRPEVFEAGADLVLARSMERTAAILHAALRVHRAPRVSVDRGGATVVRLSAEGEARLPGMDSWASQPRAVRFEHGAERDDHRGVVWLIGAGDELTIEQYRTTAEGRLLEWATIEEHRATVRLATAGRSHV